MKQNLLYVFNQFANYLEKNNSNIRIKIENDNIMYIDKRVDTDCITWFILIEKIPLEIQINYFFFGKKCESTKNLPAAIKMFPLSIFEYCNRYLIDICLLGPFGFPRTIEELAMKMDLLGI